MRAGARAVTVGTESLGEMVEEGWMAVLTKGQADSKSAA